jgi:hypothetical protein
LTGGKIAFAPYLHWLIRPRIGGEGPDQWEFPVVLETANGAQEVVFASRVGQPPDGTTLRGEGGPMRLGATATQRQEPRILERGPAVPKVILAIIDIDIAFAHARFCWRDQRGRRRSRIAWFWDQGADNDPNEGPEIGREMFSSDIERRLEEHQGDEAALYARYWAETRTGSNRRPQPPALAHGTHVLDTASSDLDSTEVAIFAVELPGRIVEPTHGAFLFPYVQLGIDRIVKVAESWAGPHGKIPVVLNFSFGSYAGRHDGETRFERYLDDRIRRNEIAAMCIAAGNSYETRTHARLTGAAEIAWHIQPGDGTPSFLQIWLPWEVGSGRDLRLKVTPPAGEPLTLDGLSPGYFHELAAEGEVLARAYVETDKGVRTPRTCVTLAVRHTDRFTELLGYPSGRPELVGDWNLELTPTGLQPGEAVMIWVERDDVVPGTRTRARQSYLRPRPPSAAAPQREDKRRNTGPTETIRYDGTINDFGTGGKTVVVAGYRRSDGRRARYSSLGFRLNGHQYLPTISAVCEESPAHGGVLAAGWSSGSVRAMGGTSVATALVSREVVKAILEQKDVAEVLAPETGSPPIEAVHRLSAEPRLASRRRPDHPSAKAGRALEPFLEPRIGRPLAANRTGGV